MYGSSTHKVSRKKYHLETFQNICGANSFVMIGRMVFSEIVGKVVDSFVPFYVELVLGNLITKPVVFHVP